VYISFWGEVIYEGNYMIGRQRQLYESASMARPLLEDAKEASTLRNRGLLALASRMSAWNLGAEWGVLSKATMAKEREGENIFRD
jgi:hypothetical protein